MRFPTPHHRLLDRIQSRPTKSTLVGLFVALFLSVAPSIEAIGQTISPGDTLVMTFRTEGSTPYYVRDSTGAVEFDGHLGITTYEGDTLIVGERIDRYRHEALLRGDTVIIGSTSILRVTEPIQYVDDPGSQTVGAPLYRARKEPADAEREVVATFTGNGIASTRPFEVDGPWVVEWDTDAPSIGIFAYEPGDPNSTYPGVIAMRNSSGSGSSYVDRGGRYYFKVTCLGEWTLRVRRSD